jgi:hypothetical protein
MSINISRKIDGWFSTSPVQAELDVLNSDSDPASLISIAEPNA